MIIPAYWTYHVLRMHTRLITTLIIIIVTITILIIYLTNPDNFLQTKVEACEFARYTPHPDNNSTSPHPITQVQCPYIKLT